MSGRGYTPQHARHQWHWYERLGLYVAVAAVAFLGAAAVTAALLWATR